MGDGLGSALLPLGGSDVFMGCRSMAEFVLVDGEELPESEVWLGRRVETGIRDEADRCRALDEEVGDVGDLTPLLGLNEAGVIGCEQFPARSLRDLRWRSGGVVRVLVVSRDGV